MKLLLIDHHDSFIYNIKAWLENTLFKIDIVNVDELSENLNESINLESYQGIILSPGPKSPNDYPKSLELLETTNLPVLGVCLGMQMMLVKKDLAIEVLDNPKHGKSSEVVFFHPYFSELKKPTTVARYHSLGFKRDQDQNFFAKSEDGVIMAYMSDDLKHLGLQFHPESFLTTESAVFAKIVRNWFLQGTQPRPLGREK